MTDQRLQIRVVQNQTKKGTEKIYKNCVISMIAHGLFFFLSVILIVTISNECNIWSIIIKISL